MDIEKQNSDKLRSLMDAKMVLVSCERNVLILFTLNFTFFKLYIKLKNNFFYLQFIMPLLIILYYIEAISDYYLLLVNINPRIRYINYLYIHILCFLTILTLSFFLYFTKL